MKTPIARSIASTVKTSVVGTLWSMKRARKRNAPAAVVVAEGTAAVAADAVATAAAVVVEAAAEIEVIVATAATAGN